MKDAQLKAPMSDAKQQGTLVPTTETIDPIPARDMALIGAMQEEAQLCAHIDDNDWQDKVDLSHLKNYGSKSSTNPTPASFNRRRPKRRALSSGA